MDDTKKHEIAGVSPPPPFEDVRVEMESYQPSYTRLSATGRAAFDAYDGPVNCGPPGRMNFDQGRRREMDAELKDRARALVERWFPAPGGEPEWSKAVMVDDLTTLLAEVRAETEARVVEAVKRAIVGLRYDNPAQSAEECAWDDALWGAYRAIDAISPEDWIGVRAEDLAGLVDAARGAVSAAELIDRDRATDAGFLLALRMADALRDALARLP